MTETPPPTSATDASVASLAASVANAVTPSGANGPDNVSVKRPAKEVVRTLLVTLGFVLLGVSAVIWLAAYPQLWGMQQGESTVLYRLSILKWIALSLCADVALIVFAFATPFVGRVEAEAGNNKLVLSGRDTHD